MFRSLEDVMDVAVHATDGEIGKVRNFLFDDQSWRIRYLVVAVGSWFSRRDAIIAVTAVEQPDWENKIFRTRLTRDQVRHSPDIDSEKPVSWQQEIAMSEYYGWPGYWEDSRNLEFPLISAPVGREFPVHTKEDPHLRSAEAVSDYEVWAEDGEIGRLENFIVDEASWHSRVLGCEIRRLASQPLGADSHSLDRVHFLGRPPRACASHPREGLASVRRQNLRSGTRTVCIVVDACLCWEGQARPRGFEDAQEEFLLSATELIVI